MLVESISLSGASFSIKLFNIGDLSEMKLDQVKDVFPDYKAMLGNVLKDANLSS